MMSMVMFSSMGLVSVSQAMSGAVSKWSLDTLFLIAGGTTLLVTVWTAAQPSLRRFANRFADAEPVPEQG